MPSMMQSSSSVCEMTLANLEKMRLVSVPGMLKVMLLLSRAACCRTDAFIGPLYVQQTSIPEIGNVLLLTLCLGFQMTDLLRR